MSTTYGNSTTGTFKHPAEIFNFQKLLSVPNPFNIDLSLYTATAAASASPIKPPSEHHPWSLQQAHTLCILETRQHIYALCAVPLYSALPSARYRSWHAPGGPNDNCDRPGEVLSRLCQQLNELCVQSGRRSRKCHQWRLRQGRRPGQSKDRQKGPGPARAAAEAAAMALAAAGATAAAATMAAASAAVLAAAAPPASRTSLFTLRPQSLLPQAFR